jgi:hypothetical protein
MKVYLSKLFPLRPQSNWKESVQHCCEFLYNWQTFTKLHKYCFVEKCPNNKFVMSIESKLYWQNWKTCYMCMSDASRHRYGHFFSIWIFQRCFLQRSGNQCQVFFYLTYKVNGIRFLSKGTYVPFMRKQWA